MRLTYSVPEVSSVASEALSIFHASFRWSAVGPGHDFILFIDKVVRLQRAPRRSNHCDSLEQRRWIIRIKVTVLASLLNQQQNCVTQEVS